jgi:hypothetical protein
MGSVLSDEGTISVAATETVPPIPGAASDRQAVNRLLTSVVQEICTLRSVGAGGG